MSSECTVVLRFYNSIAKTVRARVLPHPSPTSHTDPSCHSHDDHTSTRLMSHLPSAHLAHAALAVMAASASHSLFALGCRGMLPPVNVAT